MKHLKKALGVFGLMTAVFALFFLTALPVHAAGGLNISTPYPGMTVTAGKTVNFSLTLDNSGFEPLNTEVSVSGLPTGWDAYFSGGGNQVSRVYVRADNSATVSLAIDIPANTKEGDYSVDVTANVEGVASDTLNLALHVSATDVSQGLFTSQFPELQGGATTSFSFNADLTNSGAEDSYFSLSAGAPDGWQVGFRPASASSDIASLSIAAGQSQGLTISVKPPPDVKAGEYTIPCAAVSNSGSMTLDLKVIITGTYSLALTTKDGRLNADAQVGKETPVTLVIANTGSADLMDVNLTSALPTSGWAVRFDQATIDVLAAGSTLEIIAYIQPDARATTGDYAASIAAGTSQANTKLDLRVAVKTSTLWGVVAVVIIVLLAGGLYLVFRKFGRR